MSSRRPPYRFVIGIDLGTTNTALAYVDLTSTEAATRVETFQIPQLVAPGLIGTLDLLPSFLYLPGGFELSDGATAIPWDADRKYIVGELAREQGSRIGERLVASAKSWLSHAGVNREAPILPWGSDDQTVDKISPLEASSRYLQHLREAWNWHWQSQTEADPGNVRFEDQLVVLTVPASFDEVARELTVRAANDAGIEHVVLLEEPQAAFYEWLAEHETTWQEMMQPGQLILVCDVGGGTTDFSIIGVRQRGSEQTLERLAVGEHLMLGGDNIDLTLARHLEAELTTGGERLQSGRWLELVSQSRKAKERLLGVSNDGVAKGEAVDDLVVDITIAGSGSKLIGGSTTVKLTRSQVNEWVVDGFFPSASYGEPLIRRRSGLQEMGLPYVQDPAITRHLAAFWQRNLQLLARGSGRSEPRPDFILFNGGTLVPELLRDRIRQTVGAWFGEGSGWLPQILENRDLTRAVAQGAAHYGLARLGIGTRVGSGTPHTFYVGVEGSEIDEGSVQVLCLVPRGAEEGFRFETGERSFAARTNQPVAFQIYTSSIRLSDRAGDLLQAEREELAPLPPLQTVLRYGRRGQHRQIPVALSAELTEVGTLELWCESQESDHRWRLAFDVRQQLDADEVGDEDGEAPVDSRLVAQIQKEVERVYAPDGTGDPNELRDSLEGIIGQPREEWSSSILRPLADALFGAHESRRLSSRHEQRWLNLVGYALRPGYGDPLDQWRIEQIWKLQFAGLKDPREAQARMEWWVLWRRIAGGLSSGQQTQLYHQMRALIQTGGKKKREMPWGFPRHLNQAERNEIWMALASFERLSASARRSLGKELLGQMDKRASRKQIWAISRLGARNSVYGPADTVVDPETADSWIRHLLGLALEPDRASGQALVLMAKVTGDRVRDGSNRVRKQVADWLRENLSEPERLLELLFDPSAALRSEEQSWIFGESLPPGLIVTEPAPDSQGRT